MDQDSRQFEPSRKPSRINMAAESQIHGLCHGSLCPLLFAKHACTILDKSHKGAVRDKIDEDRYSVSMSGRDGKQIQVFVSSVSAKHRDGMRATSSLRQIRTQFSDQVDMDLSIRTGMGLYSCSGEKDNARRAKKRFLKRRRIWHKVPNIRNGR
jgi:hypothetical protein